MATISRFRCSKCNQEFTLVTGLLERDLPTTGKGADLPGGRKLPDKKSFAKIFSEKTAQRALDFNNQLSSHRRKCDGEVKLVSVVLGH